ncbi:MAG: cysteine desulfurase family protein [bacterium]|nr:cysteine desulfurase family protein [bacterium]
MKLTYADYAAATPTDLRVVEAMAPYQTETFGNPSSSHSFGRSAHDAITESTQRIADFLNSNLEEVYFTSGGTESNNLAILGVAKANKTRGRHIVTTAIEHPSVLNACRVLEKDGWEVTYLPVTGDGLVETSELEKALKAETTLVSVHLANSEIGVVQNVAELVKITKSRGIYFHTDACQAATYLDLNVEKLGVDLLTFNGSKMYGPKGVAVLNVREGVQIFPILYGGGQQSSLRSGTENVPGIIGLATACQIAIEQRETDSKRIGQLRDDLQVQLEKVPGVIINCANSSRLPNHLSVTLTNATATNLVEAFDEQGVAVSSGSACSSKSLVDSKVLQSVGLTNEQIHKTIRISLGRQTSEKDTEVIELVAKGLKKGASV